MKIHKSVTVARVARAFQRSMTSLCSPGFCKACGKSAEGVEPDARGYACKSCGAAAVYGAEELLLEMA